MSDDLVVVYVTNSDFDARVVAGLLESEGIPTLVQQESLGRSTGITIGSLGEVRVAVRAQDYETALDILDSTPDESLLSEENDDDQAEE